MSFCFPFCGDHTLTVCLSWRLRKPDAEAVKNILINRAEAAARINLFQSANFATQWWPSMVPTNNITKVTYTTAFEVQQCFSNAPGISNRGYNGGCISGAEKDIKWPPSGYKYYPNDDYMKAATLSGNLTQLTFQSGSNVVHFLEASYTTKDWRWVGLKQRHKVYPVHEGRVKLTAGLVVN